MEAHLSKACWRAGAKLFAGFALIGAVVGIRIVTAKPTGIEAEIAELERFEAEQAAGGSAAGADGSGAGAESLEGSSASRPRSAGGLLDGSDREDAGPAAAGTDALDPDRMVRCHLAGQVQFMRAADCGLRGGGLEELPPPEPEDPTASRATP